MEEEEWRERGRGRKKQADRQSLSFRARRALQRASSLHARVRSANLIPRNIPQLTSTTATLISRPIRVTTGGAFAPTAGQLGGWRKCVGLLICLSVRPTARLSIRLCWRRLCFHHYGRRIVCASLDSASDRWENQVSRPNASKRLQPPQARAQASFAPASKPTFGQQLFLLAGGRASERSVEIA